MCVLTDINLIGNGKCVTCSVAISHFNDLLVTISEKNGVGVTGVVDMKTPSARKQASRRSTTSGGQKPTPLRGE